MKSRGILLCAWGKIGYGYAAFNLAASIKFYCHTLPITLITDDVAISQLDDQHRGIFDSIITLEEKVKDPGLFKAAIYDKLPYDYTLFLDVDALCIGDVEKLLVQLIVDYENSPEEKYYRTYVHEWYDKNSPVDLPWMYWARRDVIWDTYNFTDHNLPATQSSIQFIAKCEKSEKFYASFFDLMKNHFIPLEALTNQWGGGQPDELYLNIQIAKEGIRPDIHGAMWFVDNSKYRPFQLQQMGYCLLSYFGVKEKMKGYFLDFYDREQIITLRKQGFKNHLYKSRDVFNRHKHAATVTNKQTARYKVNLQVSQNKALQRKAENEIYISKSEKKINLFTTYYKAATSTRQSELDLALQLNLNNPFISRVFVFAETSPPFDNEKLTVIDSNRVTFKQAIDHINEITGEDEINILCNSDISMTESISMVKDFALSKKVLCLSRWERMDHHYDYEYSQDTWIWEGKLKIKGGDYHFGLLGCDNKFAYDCFASGYMVLNPSRHIRTMHHHLSPERNYSEKTRLPRPYLHVPVCDLSDVKQKRLLLHQPGKVGDMIICLPIAKYYANKGYQVDWLCPKTYHDFQPYIDYCTFITSPNGQYDVSIDLSFGLVTTTRIHAMWIKRRGSLDSFVRLKYELANVPIDELRNLDYKRNIEKENKLFDLLAPEKPYKLLHAQSDYGSAISVDGNVIDFKPVDGFSILDWRKIIENASEIHCIDSSVANFVDCLDVEAKLFYHPTDKCPLKGDETILTKKWTRVNEPEYANS